MSENTARCVSGEPVQETRRDVFALPEGEVVFQWPARLSAESFEELSEWSALMLRKIGRSVLPSSRPPADANSNEEEK